MNSKVKIILISACTGVLFLILGFFASYRYNEQVFLVAQVNENIFTYTIRHGKVETFTGDFSPEREFVADKIKEVKAKNNGEALRRIKEKIKQLGGKVISSKTM